MATITYDYSKLRGLIKEKYSTISLFSQDLGISQTSLSQKLNNKVSFSQIEIDKAKRLLGIKDSEIADIFFKEKIRKTV